jgi:hypothetical protein
MKKLILLFTLIYMRQLNAQVCFGDATNFAVNTNPISMITTDFNGDGKADLATANYATNDISVLLGDGTGNFGTATNFTVGTNPISVFSTDFNGDGKADLVSANFSANNISVLLGTGTGSFGTAINFSTALNPRAIVSADFNGDGKADVATANYTSNNISVLLGDGAGNFGPDSNFTVGTNPISITSADFNGDSHADLAIANYSSTNISVYLGTGTGSFGTIKNIALSGTPVPTPQTVISADFNKDGKMDLALAYSNANAAILIGNGTGGFASPTLISIGQGTNSLFSADFNGDSYPDLATSDNSTDNISVSILGGTVSSFTATAVSFLTDDEPQAVVSADFNGDGRPDLASANYNSNDVSILLNSTSVLQLIAKSRTCPGINDTISASGATTYLWHPNATLIDTHGANDSVGTTEIAVPYTSTIYTVTGSYGSHCTSTSTITITVNKLPTITISMNPADTCKKPMSPLTASGANTYIWTSTALTGTVPTTGATIIATPTATSTYSVTGTDTNGCQGKTSIVQIVSSKCTTGIDQLSNNNNQFVLYPNPSNGIFTIETTTIERQLVQILDLTGKMVYNEYINGNTNLDTGSIPGGFYTIRISGNGGIATKKLIICR